MLVIRVACFPVVDALQCMNFDLLPELKWSFGYPLTLADMVATDVCLLHRFRQARWLQRTP